MIWLFAAGTLAIGTLATGTLATGTLAIGTGTGTGTLATGALSVAPGSASLPSDADTASEDVRVALNPNISIGSCSGAGQAIEASSGMTTVSVSGAFYGDLSANAQFSHPDYYYCNGYVPPEPQLCMHVGGAGAALRVEVTASQGYDTVMVITGTNDDFLLCDDDGGYDLRSRIDHFFEPGDYLIYIGSYSQGVGGSFVVEVDTDAYYY